MGSEKVQVSCWLSGESAALLRSLAAIEGRAIGRVLESAIAAYAGTSKDTSDSLVPAGDDTSTATSAPLADALERLAMLEGRMSAMEARMSATPTGAKETALEPGLLTGKGRVAGRAEDSPAPLGSRENKAQKRSLHGTTDDEFDAVSAKYLRDGVKATGRAMREAGFSFPEQRLTESLKRLARLKV